MQNKSATAEGFGLPNGELIPKIQLQRDLKWRMSPVTQQTCTLVMIFASMLWNPKYRENRSLKECSLEQAASLQSTRVSSSSKLWSIAALMRLNLSYERETNLHFAFESSTSNCESVGNQMDSNSWHGEAPCCGQRVAFAASTAESAPYSDEAESPGEFCKVSVKNRHIVRSLLAVEESFHEENKTVPCSCLSCDHY